MLALSDVHATVSCKDDCCSMCSQSANKDVCRARYTTYCKQDTCSKGTDVGLNIVHCYCEYQTRFATQLLCLSDCLHAQLRHATLCYAMLYLRTINHPNTNQRRRLIPLIFQQHSSDLIPPGIQPDPPSSPRQRSGRSCQS